MQAGASFFDDKTPDIVIRSLFDKYDTNSSGFLEASELKELLEKDLGLLKEQANVYSLLLDKDGDRSISFDEFLAWLRSGERFKTISDKPRFRMLCKAVALFQNFDKDNSNNLNQEELEQLLDSFGYKGIDVPSFFHHLDQHNNGNISFWELMKWLNWVPVR